MLFPHTCQYYLLFSGILTKKTEVNNMKPLKERVSITIDNDILVKIKELAEQDDRSFSQYVNLVLREHIDKVQTSLLNHK